MIVTIFIILSTALSATARITRRKVLYIISAGIIFGGIAYSGFFANGDRAWILPGIAVICLCPLFGFFLGCIPDYVYEGGHIPLRSFCILFSIAGAALCFLFARSEDTAFLAGGILYLVLGIYFAVIWKFVR